MRYLWVEDFDGGQSGQTQIRNNLEQYFQLEKDKYINFTTLESALSFLDDIDNWKKFDAVLIDIRFKVCEKEEDKMKIYHNYFESFLTKTKYEYYSNPSIGDANAASSGVLLYLALIHRYNYNQNRIAFISANIDDMPDELCCFFDIKEYLIKARYDNLTIEDKDDFSVLVEEAVTYYQKTLKISEEDADEKFNRFFSENITFKDYDILYDLEKKVDSFIEEIQNNISEKSTKTDIDLKFNSVKKEFEEVGLIVPIAFEKPTDNTRSDKSWSFQNWVDNNLNTDYYKSRSTILPICLEINEYIEEPNDIKKVMFDIMQLFPENENRWTQHNTTLYSKVIKECVRLSDNIKINKDKDNGSLKDAYNAVLKITRNWMSHQGISKVDTFDVFFIFHIFINNYITEDLYEKIKKLDMELLSEFCQNSQNNLVSEKKDIITTLKNKYLKMHELSYKKFEKEASEKDKKDAIKKNYTYKEKANFYDIISAIGHEYSPKRNEVSMEMLYALFIVSLGENNIRHDNSFINEVISKVKL